MRDLPVIKIDVNKPEDFGNLAEKLDAAERRTLAIDLCDLIRIDERSMSEWVGEARGYLDDLNSDDNKKPSNREQEGSGEEPPPSTEMTLSAVVQFAARATDALLGSPDLARSSEADGQGQELAAWVSKQFRTVDKNWVADTDPMIIHMGVTGLAWRKRTFDDIDKAFHSYFLTCEEVIINKNVRSPERAPRITHQFERYPYEIQRSMERGHWIDYDPIFDDSDPEAPKKFYEVDLWLDLDGDGISEPWTIVISRDDHAEVIRISPRWSKKTVVSNDNMLVFNPIHRFYPYRMMPSADGSFLPMGYGKLLHRVESTADELLGSITDTAKTESENGGVMGGSQFGLPDHIEVKGNRITTIPTDGAPLQNMFSQFPVKSVSSGSVQVLEKIMTLGDRLSGSLNALENAPASMTATLAKGVIDNGAQIQSSIHRRMVTALTGEMIAFVWMADAYDMLPKGIQASDAGTVTLTADPALATDMQRSALIGFLFELLKAPQFFNGQYVAQQIIMAARLPNADKWAAAPQGPPQATPYEKMEGAIKLMKQRTESIKVTGQVAVQLTQALLNMVTAAGGMQDNRAALLTMAQLEQAVTNMMQGAGDAGTTLDGMANQPGNGAAPQISGPAAGGSGGPIPGGDGSGGPALAGQGGGVQ